MTRRENDERVCRPGGVAERSRGNMGSNLRERRMAID